MQDPLINLIVFFQNCVFILQNLRYCTLEAVVVHFRADSGITINYKVCSLSLANVCFPIRQWFSNFNIHQHHLGVLLKFRLLDCTPRVSDSVSESGIHDSVCPTSAHLCWRLWERDHTVRTSVVCKGFLWIKCIPFLIRPSCLKIISWRTATSSSVATETWTRTRNEAYSFHCIYAPTSRHPGLYLK